MEKSKGNVNFDHGRPSIIWAFVIITLVVFSVFTFPSQSHARSVLFDFETVPGSDINPTFTSEGISISFSPVAPSDAVTQWYNDPVYAYSGAGSMRLSGSSGGGTRTTRLDFSETVYSVDFHAKNLQNG